MNRAERRRQGPLLLGVCTDGETYAEVEIEVSEVRRLMRAEGLSFEQAAMELVAAGCPMCHGQNSN